MAGVVNRGDHAFTRFSIEAAHRVGINFGHIGGGRPGCSFWHLDRADGHGVAHSGDAKLRQKPLGHGAQGYACRGFAGAGTLERRARLAKPVFLHPDEVGVTWAGTGERGAAAGVEHFGVGDRFGRHDLLPFGPLGVLNANTERRGDRVAVPHTRREGELILFKFHPPAATVAEFATRQISTNIIERNGDAGGQPLKDCEQFGAV